MLKVENNTDGQMHRLALGMVKQTSQAPCARYRWKRCLGVPLNKKIAFRTNGLCD